MIENEFEKNISQLHSEGKWEEIISLCKNEDDYKVRRLLWVWPTITDLNWIKDSIVEFDLNGIASIGCGTGLLEWIILQYCGCSVIGVEVDQYWWKSRYSPKLYLDDVKFVDETNALIEISNNYGIMFCYFNNGRAFENYINRYNGEILFIIGPIEGQARTTNPSPFDRNKLNNLGWQLNKMRNLDNNRDCIAIYKRS